MPKTKEQLFAERRQAVRTKRILSIQFRLYQSRSGKKEDAQWHISTTHDMSAVGLSFVSDAPYQVGDILELNMVLSGVLDIYKGFGKVVRVEERVAGLIFLIAVKFVEEKLPKK